MQSRSSYKPSEFSGHVGTEIEGYTEKLSNVNWKQVFNLLVVSWRSQPYETDPHCRWAAPQGLTKNLFRNYHCWHQDSHEQLKYVSLPPRFRWRSASLSPRPISGDWMELLLVGARRLPGDGRGGRQDEERRGNVNIAFWIKVDNGHQATALSFWCSHIFPSFLFWFRISDFMKIFHLFM